MHAVSLNTPPPPSLSAYELLYNAQSSRDYHFAILQLSNLAADYEQSLSALARRIPTQQTSFARPRVLFSFDYLWKERESRSKLSKFSIFFFRESFELQLQQ